MLPLFFLQLPFNEEDFRVEFTVFVVFEVYLLPLQSQDFHFRQNSVLKAYNALPVSLHCNRTKDCLCLCGAYSLIMCSVSSLLALLRIGSGEDSNVVRIVVEHCVATLPDRFFLH